MRECNSDNVVDNVNLNNVQNYQKSGYTAGALAFIVVVLAIALVMLFVLYCEIFGKGIDRFIDSLDFGSEAETQAVKIITVPVGPVKHLFPLHK